MSKKSDYIESLKPLIHKYFFAFRLPISLIDINNHTILCFPKCGDNTWPSKNNKMCLDNYYSFSQISSTKLVIMEHSLYLGIIPVKYDMFILIGPIMPHVYTLSELLAGLRNQYTDEEIITYYNINSETGYIDSMRFSYIVSIIAEAMLNTTVDANVVLNERIIATTLPTLEIQPRPLPEIPSTITESVIESEKSSLFSVRCDRYIFNHLREKITANELAIALNVSERTLYRLFKENFDIPPNDYIHQKKINNSLGMLCRTNMPISEISSYWGYSSQSHYNKAFEKVFGMSPGEYRKRNKI